ncbi:HAUS augmin-like complex subunit 8 [Bombina bombina]|uniref:HAUS augmin-like complex subunit 8 n=1 Tax=Bombina bombina TaxID=8345 RepID=UPI00235B3052|nr:HAUS augmin-like complex subunit 8 [Bombina bombina]
MAGEGKLPDARLTLLEDESQNISGGSSGDSALKKSKATKVVKSRYMQYDKSKVGKKNVANITTCSAEKPPERGGSGTPTRRSIAPQRMKVLAGLPSNTLDGSLFVKNNLQSTLLEGHRIARPDLDISVINDKTMQRLTPKLALSAEQKKNKREATALYLVPEETIEMIESQTLLSTYLTMKMQKNLSRLEEKAENNLLQVTEEKNNLEEKVHVLKRELSVLQQEEQVNDLLEKQAKALTPSTIAEEKFKDNYTVFATALDCTRHQLPIKDVHIVGNHQQYLEDLRKQLAITEPLLQEAMSRSAVQNAESLDTIKELEELVLKTDAELSLSFRQILDLSFKVNKEITLQNQKREEENCSLDLFSQLYFD